MLDQTFKLRWWSVISVSGMVVMLYVNHFIKSSQLPNDVGTISHFLNERIGVCRP